MEAVAFHNVDNPVLTVAALDTAGRRAAGSSREVADPDAVLAAGIEVPDTAVAGIGAGCSLQAECLHKTPGGTCLRTCVRRWAGTAWDSHTGSVPAGRNPAVDTVGAAPAGSLEVAADTAAAGSQEPAGILAAGPELSASMQPRQSRSAGHAKEGSFSCH